MAVKAITVTAGTTATLLYKAVNPKGDEVLITTHGNSADIYIGGSTVTSSSNGIVAPKSQNLQITVPYGETIYCAGNGTDTAKLLVFTNGN